MSRSVDTISVRLSPEIRDGVERLANVSKRSRSFIVQTAVANYVRDHSAYVEELEKALASAKGGVGHSGEQVFEWMRSWGQEGEKPAPAPDVFPVKQ